MYKSAWPTPVRAQQLHIAEVLEKKKDKRKKKQKLNVENRTQETPIFQVFFKGLGHFHVL